MIYRWLELNWPLWAFILVGIVLILFIWAWNKGHWRTGFRGYDKVTEEYGPKGNLLGSTQEYQPGKTLWDWLQLLIIPMILAGATIGLGLWQVHLADLQHQADQDRAVDQQRAAILQTYIDNIQDLLLNHNLLGDNPKNDADKVTLQETQELARARTLTALQGLDSGRKGRLLVFLHEANLIGFEDTKANLHDPIISLSEANLSGADLSNADLSGATVFTADLSKEQPDLIRFRFFPLSQQQLDQVYTCKGAKLPQGLTCHYNR